MGSSVATRERDFLQTLVPGYEADGFSVFLHPTREMLPPFLRGYQPDAMAVRADKKIVIEIKSDANRHAVRMERLQQILSDHPEWEFRVYYVPNSVGDEDIEVSRIPDIDAALAEVDQLKQAGHLRAALMMAWSALEAASRALLPQNLARPQSVARLIEALAAEGVVTPSEADSLRKAVSARNAATHGDFAVPITEQDLDQIIAAATSVTGLAKQPSSP
jgi:uncharacterized protein YutE (UPF0331/DUF86 family)